MIMILTVLSMALCLNAMNDPEKEQTINESIIEHDAKTCCICLDLV